MGDGGDVDDGRDAGVVGGGEERGFEEAGERGGSEEVDLGDASDALGRVRLGDEVGAGVVDEDVEARGARGHGRGERADAGVGVEVEGGPTVTRSGGSPRRRESRPRRARPR